MTSLITTCLKPQFYWNKEQFSASHKGINLTGRNCSGISASSVPTLATTHHSRDEIAIRIKLSNEFD